MYINEETALMAVKGNPTVQRIAKELLLELLSMYRREDAMENRRTARSAESVALYGTDEEIIWNMKNHIARKFLWWDKVSEHQVKDRNTYLDCNNENEVEDLIEELVDFLESNSSDINK